MAIFGEAVKVSEYGVTFNLSRVLYTEMSRIGIHTHDLLLDFFRGQEVESINLAGLSHVISVTAVGSETDEKPRIYFRVYGTIAQVK